LTQASIAGSGVGNFILAGVLMFISLCLGSSSYGLLYLNRKLSRALAPSLWRHFVSISLVFALMQVAVAGNVMDIMIGTSLFSAMLFFLAFPVQSSNS
ncbi:MAG: hypothetical protein OIF35_07975, partial [Cellvibrionaceae bacterium]|nr:hypothetical protein [Cellvibrionaceae bacterium]